MRTIACITVMVALCPAAACTGKPNAAAPSGGTPLPTSSSTTSPSRSISLNCSDPIDVVPSPTRPHSDILGVVGLDITSTLQVNSTGGTGPHRLFAKTGLLIHAGRDAYLSVSPDWAAQVSIAWGNHAAEWTDSLYIPACPPPPSGSGRWLVYPGGFTLDKAACVPLDIRTGGRTTTVHVSVGTRCPR
jgi:hypothetical protein